MSRRKHPYALVADVQALQSGEFVDRGVSRYVAELTAAELRGDGLVESMVLSPQQPYPRRLRHELAAAPQLAWNTASAFARAFRARSVAYHVMSPVASRPMVELMPGFVRDGRIPLVTSLYDLVPLLMPDAYFDSGVVPEPFLHRMGLYRESQLILALSRSSARDAVRLLGVSEDVIAVVGAGVSSFFSPGDADAARLLVQSRFPALTRPFVLSVTGVDARKNTEALIDAFALLPETLRRSFQLVLCCGADEATASRWTRRAAARNIGSNELLLTRAVGDDDLRALYRAATVTVLPSLYEGFGLPVVESLACGTPALASAASSLPELLDDERTLFDPHSPADIASHLQRALEDEQLRRDLVAGGAARMPQHSWDAVAGRVAAALDHLPPPRPSRRRRRLRIALAGPYPPTLSGVAHFNARLAAQLSDLCDLQRLYTGERPPPLNETQCPAYPVRALGTHINAFDFDAVIYAMGNSEHHFDTFEVAMRNPGVLYLHDARIGMSYLMYELLRARSVNQSWLKDNLRDMYGPRIPVSALDDFQNRDEHARYWLGCTRQWVAASRAVLVSSAFAERMVRLDQGPDASLPPLHRVPFPVTPAPDASLPPIDDGDDRPVVATFGFVDSVKGTGLLLEAMRLVRRHVDARLVFVGYVDDPQRTDLVNAAAALDTAGAVGFSGPTTKALWGQWLKRATIGVQLRTSTNGEMSGTVADCLGAGVPVITNIIQAAEEYPPSAVTALPNDVSASELADSIVLHLRDPALRSRMRRSAVEYAATQTFRALALRVVEVCSALDSVRR